MKNKIKNTLLLIFNIALVNSVIFTSNAADTVERKLDQIPKIFGKNVNDKKINDFIANLKTYANKGNTKAMIGIGKVYMLYGGDVVSAAEWFKKAEQNNDSDAYCAFGQLYELILENTNNETRDFSFYKRYSVNPVMEENVKKLKLALLSKKVIQFYQKGVKVNNVKSMIALGKFYSQFEVTHKYAEAMLKKATKTNNPKAFTALGKFYKNVIDDEFVAFDNFKKAANLNDVEAMNILIDIYDKKRSKERCLYWLEKVVKLNLSTDELVDTIRVAAFSSRIGADKINQILLNTTKAHEYQKMRKISEAYNRVIYQFSKHEYWAAKATLSEQIYKK